MTDNEKSLVAAAEAAALEKAAGIVNEARGTDYDLRGIAASIRALIPTSGESALSKVIQAAKREEAEIWDTQISANERTGNRIGLKNWRANRIAELRAALGPEEK